MTNVEYIFKFADKHNFPKTTCEVIFHTPQTLNGTTLQYEDYDIKSVKFDSNLVENEIKIEDIRFDVDSGFDDDVFFMWQKDEPKMSFRGWIALGRYIPNIIENSEYLNELEELTKDIEIKLNNLFSRFETDDGSSDFEDENDDFEDEENDGE